MLNNTWPKVPAANRGAWPSGPTANGRLLARCFLGAALLLFPLVLAGESRTAAEYNAAVQKLWGDKQMADAYRLAAEGHRRFPHDGELLGRLAYSENRLKRAPYGTGLIERAFALSPEHANLRAWRMDIYLSAGYFEPDSLRAVKYWEQALAIDPTVRGYRYAIGAKYSNAKRYRESLEWLNAARVEGHDAADLFFYQAWNYLHLKDFPAALVAADACVKREPANAGCYYVRGGIHANLDRDDLWIVDTQKYLELKPDDVDTTQLLAGLLSGFGRFKESASVYRSMLQRFESNSRVALWREALLKVEPRPIEVILNYKPASGLPRTGLYILPVENAHQVHGKHVVEPPPASEKVIYHAGNRFLELTYPEPPAAIRVTLALELVPRSIAQGDSFVAPGQSDPGSYVSLSAFNGSERFNASDPAVIRLARVIVGAERNPIGRARKIQKWIAKNITYKVLFHRTLEEYLRERTAECGGHAIIFAGLARAVGIPARTVFSPLLEYKGERLASHATAEFFADGVGWVPVDLTARSFGHAVGILIIYRTQSTAPEVSFHGPTTYAFADVGPSAPKTRGLPPAARPAPRPDARLQTPEGFTPPVLLIPPLAPVPLRESKD